MTKSNEVPTRNQEPGPESLIPGTDVPHNKGGLLTDKGRAERMEAASSAGMPIGEAHYWAGSGSPMTVGGREVVVRRVRTEAAPSSSPRPPFDAALRGLRGVRTPRSRPRAQ